MFDDFDIQVQSDERYSTWEDFFQFCEDLQETNNQEFIYIDTCG